MVITATVKLDKCDRIKNAEFIGVLEIQNNWFLVYQEPDKEFKTVVGNHVSWGLLEHELQKPQYEEYKYFITTSD